MLRTDGGISINGKHIGLFGSGRINVKAQGNLWLKGRKIRDH